MKTLKEIREKAVQLDEADDKKLTSLIRAGLFDINKLPLLRRALSKDNTKMTPVERNSLLELLDTLIDHVLGDRQVYNKIRTNVMHEGKLDESYEIAGDLPQVLILKRKSIRVFPDGQRVALYWSDKLKTYISVPYSSVGVGYSPTVSETIEQDNISELRKIQESGQISKIKFYDGTIADITPNLAITVLEIYDQLSDENKSIANFYINESLDSLKTLANLLKE